MILGGLGAHIIIILEYNPRGLGASVIDGSLSLSLSVSLLSLSIFDLDTICMYLINVRNFSHSY